MLAGGQEISMFVLKVQPYEATWYGVMIVATAAVSHG
jgi:prolipoprotein diacylglyceryltransferase